jgi:ABC-type glutathione transport system ATPase component
VLEHLVWITNWLQESKFGFQVRGLEVESHSSRQLLLLQGVSFEVHGGEIMAVMATAG